MKSWTSALTAAVLMLALSGCVSTYTLPEGYAGPTATIEDSAVPVSGVKSEIYRASELNGMASGSSPMKTPYGGGMGVTLGGSKNIVPAGQLLTLTLSAYDGYAADGVALANMMSGNSNEPAEKELTFTPAANATYVVKGKLGKEQSAVWLENKGSGRRVE